MTVISRWLLEEISGTNAADSVGANHGTYQATPSLGQISIVPAYPSSHSVFLLESGEYISIPNSASLQLTTGFTIKLWYQWDGSDNGFLFAKGDDYAVFLNADGSLDAFFRYETSKWREVSSPAAAVPKDEPCCIHVTYDKSKLRIYVEGIEVATGSFTDSLKTSTNIATIGRQATAESSFLHGGYQRVEVHDSGLTPTQVAEDFGADDFKVLPPWANFAGNWESGDLSEWDYVQAIPGRITVPKGGAPQGNYAGRFIVQAGDAEPDTGSQRAEVQSGREYDEGDDRYFRGIAKVVSTDFGHYIIIWQLHDDGGSSPPLSLQVKEGSDADPQLLLVGFGTEVYWEGPFNLDEAFEWACHVVFGEKGSIEFWLNGEQQTLEGGGTILEEIDTLGIRPAFDKLGIYRATLAEGTAVVYHDDYRITEEFFSDPPTASPVPAPTGGILGIEARHQWNGGATLGDPTASPRVKVVAISGLRSLPEPEDIRDNAMGRRGEIPRNSYRRGKTLVYELLLQARTLADLRQLASELAAAFDDLRDGRMLVTPDPEYAAGFSRFFRARALSLDEGPEIFNPHAAWQFEQPFALGLRMADTQYYDPQEVIDSTGGIALSGGLAPPLTPPVTLPDTGEGAGAVTVTNPGNVATEPVIDIYGPVTDPVLSNLSLRKTLAFKGVALDGATFLRVDFYARTVKLQGTSDYRLKIDWDLSDWWDSGAVGLVPGENLIQIRGTSIADPAKAQITFNPAYVA
jgi:Concanavalin A-like lectin/glucanases superfamily/Polysaccharide lyase/Phage tail protein